MVRHLLLAVFCLTCTAVGAQTIFSDVPRGHWAYECVSSLARKGLVMSLPDGTFGGKRALTRYEFAAITARVPAQLDEQLRPVDIDGRPHPVLFPLSHQDFQCLRDLAREFRPEMQTLGVNEARFSANLTRLEADPRIGPAALGLGKDGRLFQVVPVSHWVYDCIASLYGKKPNALGYVSVDAWKKRATTRYELAVITVRLLQWYQVRPADQVLYGTPPPVVPIILSDEEAGCLHRLVDEFRPELDLLHGQVKSLLGVEPAELHTALRRWRALHAQKQQEMNASAEPFPDVPRDHWAYEAVRFVAARKLMLGYPDPAEHRRKP